MSDQTGVAENRQEWFYLLLVYLKMKTWAMWLRYYPETQYETFELLWPRLLDQMLAQATSTAVKALAEQITIGKN